MGRRACVSAATPGSACLLPTHLGMRHARGLVTTGGQSPSTFDGNAHFVTSEYILEEVTRKLSERFRFPPMVAQLRKSILAAAQCVEPADIPIGTCRDPNDLPVLGTAVAAQADVLITVDKDLLELRRFAGFPIVKPGEFWHLAHG